MPIVKLDYEPTELSIEVTNVVEESYRMHSCKKEPWTVAFIESIPAGAVFWDLGANVGPYTLIAAHRNLTTVAIEPAFNNYAAMCRNLAMNNLLDRCLTLCVALGDRTRFDWFHYADARQGAGMHVLGGVRKQFFHKQLIPVWAWDELYQRLPLPLDRPQYAKIDLDGGELDALKGGPETLNRLTGLLIEFHADDKAATLDLLTKAGWKMVEEQTTRNGKSMGHVSYGRFERG